MLKMLLKSFGDSKAYAEALKTWRWKFTLYFIFLSVLSGLLLAMVETPKLKGDIDSNKEFICSQFPNAKIEGAKFSMSEKSPYFAKSKSGENLIGFTEDFLEPNQTKGLFFAFEKDRISFYLNGNETYFFYDEFVREYNKVMYPDSPEGAPLLINKQKAEEFANYVKSILPLAVAPFYLVICLIANGILVVSIAIPTFLLSLTYLPALRLIGALKFAVLAASPAIILQTLQAILGFPNISEIFFVFVSYYIVWRVMRKLSISNLNESL